MESQNLIEQAKTFLSDTSNLAWTGGGLLFLAFTFWRIFARTGNNGAMGLLMLIPGVNVVMLLVLAFGRWPVEGEVKDLRSKTKAAKEANQLLQRAA